MDTVGTVVHRRIGTNENPRNTEGAFIGLADGSLLYAWSRFDGGMEDCAAASIAAVRSRDGGRSWGGERTLLTMRGEGLSNDDPADPQNIMSVSFLRLHNGDIGLFYGIRRSWNETGCWLRRSCDEGETWGERVRCTNPLGYHVVCNDHVTKLASGRLIVPASVHRTRFLNETGRDWGEVIPQVLDLRGQAAFFLSDDDGRTWREAAGLCALDVSWSRSGLQETGALELADGTLWGWARTDVGRQYEMFSRDGGETWTAAQPARFFPSPCSPMGVKRAPDGVLYAVWNPVPYTLSGGAPELRQTRSPLAVAVSRDEGRSWSDPRILDAQEPGVPGVVEYPAVYCLPDALLVCYDMSVGDRLDMVIRRVAYTELA